MMLKSALMTAVVLMSLAGSLPLLAKPGEALAGTPGAAHASNTALQKQAATPVKPAKHPKPVKPAKSPATTKLPPAAKPAQVPELNGSSAGLALLLLAGLVTLLRETRRSA